MQDRAASRFDEHPGLVLGRKQASHGLLSEAAETFVALDPLGDADLARTSCSEAFLARYLDGELDSLSRLLEEIIRSRGATLSDMGRGSWESVQIDDPSSIALAVATCSGLMQKLMIQRHGTGLDRLVLKSAVDALSSARARLCWLDFDEVMARLIGNERFVYAAALAHSLRTGRLETGFDRLDVNLLGREAHCASEMLCYPQAITYWRAVLRELEAAGDVEGQTRAHDWLVDCYEAQSAFADALVHLKRLDELEVASGTCGFAIPLTMARYHAYLAEFEAGMVAIALAEERLALVGSDREAKRDLLTTKGNVLLAGNQLKAAEESYRLAIEQENLAVAPDPLQLGGIVYQLAMLHMKHGRLDAAAPLVDEVSQLTRDGTDWHKNKARVLRALFLRLQKKLCEAEEVLLEYVRDGNEEFGGDHVNVLESLMMLTEVCLDGKRSALAADYWRRANSVAQRFLCQGSTLRSRLSRLQTQIPQTGEPRS